MTRQNEVRPHGLLAAVLPRFAAAVAVLSVAIGCSGPDPSSRVEPAEVPAPGLLASSEGTEQARLRLGDSADCAGASIGLTGAAGAEVPALSDPDGHVLDFASSDRLDLSFESVRVITFHAALTGCDQASSDPHLYIVRTGSIAEWEGAPVRADGPHMVGSIPLPGAESIEDFSATAVLGCPDEFYLLVVVDGATSEFAFGSLGSDLKPLGAPGSTCP